jgi:uncharacterized protein
MKKQQDVIHLSASDLVGHLNCRHLTALDLSVAEGALAKPGHWDPLLELLQERGRRHEASFVDHLRSQGIDAVEIGGVDISEDAVTRTRQAMAEGAQVIVQAALQQGRWSGRADILRRIQKPSTLGGWSYEVIDTKLARETRGGTVLQLCLYADLLEQIQGAATKYVYVVAPWSDFEPQAFRCADYAAYFRRAKAAAEASTDAEDAPKVYPDPKEHCDICRWQDRCERRRRDDDHLCLVAGITKNQMTELQANGVATASALAAMPAPMPWKPQRGSPLSYERASEQARIQIETRESGVLRYELLPVEPDSGLCLLPSPSDGDIFFDIEGDPFVGEHGLEYLFGYQHRDADGQWVYSGCYGRRDFPVKRSV